MKSIKTTLIATALIGTLGLSGWAIAANEAATQRVEQLKAEFNLSDQQAQRIQGMLDPEARADMREARKAERMEHHLAKMQEELGLTGAQVAQMKVIMTEQHAKRKALRDETKQRMAAVMTPEQAQQFETMRAERKGHRGHGGGYGKHGGFGGGKHCGGRRGGEG